MESDDLSGSQKDLFTFVMENQPRRGIVKYVLQNQKAYFSELCKKLPHSRRTIHVQLGRLEEKGIIKSAWETLLIGEENRPVYIKSFTFVERQAWLARALKRVL